MNKKTRAEIKDEYIDSFFLLTSDPNWTEEMITLLERYDNWLSGIRGTEHQNPEELQIQRLCREVVKWREMSQQSHRLLQQFVLLASNNFGLNQHDYEKLYKEFLDADRNFQNSIKAAQLADDIIDQ